MSKRTFALRAAAVAGAAGLTLGLSGICTAAVAAPVTANSFGVLAVDAPASPPVLSRVSVASGTQAGGTTITLSGKDLATATTKDGKTTYSTPKVTFSIAGTGKDAKATTADATGVTALSAGVIRITTPEIAAAGKATVTVVDGVESGTTKAAVFTFSPAAPDIADKDGLTGEVKSETGGTLTITGKYLGDPKTAKVVVGGKAATVTKDDGTTITATAPAGLVDVQDVVVTTPGGSVDAGTVDYASTLPTAEFAVTTASVEKGAVLSVTGTDLNLVNGGVFTDSAKKPFKVTVAVGKKLDGKKTVPDPTKLTVTVPKGAAEGAGSLVLSTPYTSLEAQDITVVKAGKPAVKSADVASLTKAGGKIVLTGENLRTISAVKVGAVAVTDFTASEDATTLTFVVPTQLKEPSVAAISVTTDGGAASYSLPITSTTLESATYDATSKVISLKGTSLGALTLKVIGPDKAAVTAAFKAGTDGTTSASAALKTGLAGGTYTVTGTDASKATFTATFFVGTPTITKAEWTYPAVTVTGTGLQNVTNWTITSTEKDAVAAKVTPKVSKDGLTATFDQAYPTAGEYTVAGTDADGKTAVTGTKVTLTDPGFSATGASFDAVTGKLTLTGTRIKELKSVVVDADDDDNKHTFTMVPADNGVTAVSSNTFFLSAGKHKVTVTDAADKTTDLDVTVTPAVTATEVKYALTADGATVTIKGTGYDKLKTALQAAFDGSVYPLDFVKEKSTATTFVFETGRLKAGTYTLSASDVNNTPFTVDGFTVAAPTFTKAAAGADAKSIVLTGTDLVDSLTVAVAQADGDKDKVTAEFKANADHTTLTATLATALADGDYTVDVKDGDEAVGTQKTFTVSTD